MTVIEFPAKATPSERRIKGIHDCLDYLYGEALAAQIPMVAHLIGVAREASRDEMDAEPISCRR